MKDILKATVLIVGGVAVFGTAVWFIQDSARFIDGAARALGEVVAIEGRRTSRGMPLYHPVVRYHPLRATAPAASAATPVEFTAQPGLWPSPYQIGDRVEVAYHPGQPEAARIVSFWMLWFMPLAATLLGLCCVFAGWHSIRFRHR